jgi:hypothetical protein
LPGIADWQSVNAIYAFLTARSYNPPTIGGFQRQAMGRAMKNDILKGFERVIADRQKRDIATQQAAAERAFQLQQAQAQWSSAVEQVINPALCEIEQTLEHAGWTANISYLNTSVAFEIYKGNFIAAEGIGHPAISFKFEDSSRKVTTCLATPDNRASGRSFDLSGITSDDVQASVLDFFKQLADA